VKGDATGRGEGLFRPNHKKKKLERNTEREFSRPGPSEKKERPAQGGLFRRGGERGRKDISRKNNVSLRRGIEKKRSYGSRGLLKMLN